MRGETRYLLESRTVMDISIHSPHARGDSCRCIQSAAIHPFQSTPLMRGETLRLTPVAALICAFQSTPPRARGDEGGADATPLWYISIRSPLTRGDEGGADATPLWYISIRSPLTRGDHEQLVGYLGQNTISIHFPHTRGDEISVNVRRAYIISIHSPLTRGDLDGRAYELRFDNISIRSPHARGDDSCPGVDGRRRNFNPLPSYEGRLARRIVISFIVHFNPLPSYEGRRYRRKTYSKRFQISIHSPHTRGDRK